MYSRSQFICLEYSQVFGYLISGLIGYNVITNQTDILGINQYFPWQFSLKLSQRIIDLGVEDEPILNKDFIDCFADFNDAQMTIALFPLIIYCYKNNYKLEQELERLTNYVSIAKTSLNNIKIISLIIYLILDQKINCDKISIQISKGIESNNLEYLRWIKLIEIIIEQKLSLTKVEEKIINSDLSSLSNLGIYQALYSFLTMPKNWEICVHRSKQFSQQQLETTILTSFLLGLYNGYLAIPYHWRKIVSSENAKNQKLNDFNFYSSISKLENISQQIVARWQGKLEYK